MPALLALADRPRLEHVVPGAMRTLRAAVVVALLALDRATKVWAAVSLKAVGTIPLIPFFDLTYVENTGAAFGMEGHVRLSFATNRETLTKGLDKLAEFLQG